MDNKTFNWSPDALLPETITMTWFIGTNDDGSLKTEDVTHTELNRTDLLNFIKEGMDTRLIVIKTVEGVDIEESMPFSDQWHRQLGILYKFLAKTSSKDQKWFESRQLGAKGMTAVIQMMFQLNHIEEVIATGGNLFLLPSIKQITEAVDFESQKPILEV